MILQEEVDKLGTKSHVSSSTAKFSEEINLEEVNQEFFNIFNETEISPDCNWVQFYV